MKQIKFKHIILFLLTIALLFSCNDSNIGLYQAAKTAQYQTPYKVLKVLGHGGSGDSTEMYLATDKGFVVLNNIGELSTQGNESGRNMMNSFFAKRNDNSELVYVYFNNNDSTLYKKTIGKEEEKVATIDNYKYLRTYSSDGFNFIVVFEEKNPASESEKNYKIFQGTLGTNGEADPTEASFVNSLNDITVSPTLSVKGDGLSVAKDIDKSPCNIALNASGNVLVDRGNDDVFVVGINKGTVLYSDGYVYLDKDTRINLDTSFANNLIVPSYVTDDEILIIKPESSTYYIINAKTKEVKNETRSNLASISPETIAGKNGNSYLLINGTTVPGTLNVENNEYNRISANNPLSAYLN